jgi:hypothetical protein
MTIIGCNLTVIGNICEKSNPRHVDEKVDILRKALLALALGGDRISFSNLLLTRDGGRSVLERATAHSHSQLVPFLRTT